MRRRPPALAKQVRSRKSASRNTPGAVAMRLLPSATTWSVTFAVLPLQLTEGRNPGCRWRQTSTDREMVVTRS
jgi:hypothetical protein